MKVELLKNKEWEPWLLRKHYAGVIPLVSYCYGLIIDEKIEGVCTFGSPPSRYQQLSQLPYELNRLVVNEGLEKNTLSKFVSQCLKQFPEPSIIVSYADEDKNHHGYIYQATNWLYTGKIVSKRYYIDDELIHRRTINFKYRTSSISKLKKMGVNIRVVNEAGKHRYFQFTGTKREKKKFRKEIIEVYGEKPYPKGDNIKYDCPYDPNQKLDVYKAFF